jgi:DnaJ-domain-containing protein 1
LLVRSVYLDVDGARHFTPNCFFWPAGYDYAVEEKRWRDGYFRRTGRVWQEDECGSGGKSQPPDGGNDDKDLDHDACLRLLGLKPGFTEKELTAAYREAVKMNHPDRVATLAVEFQLLAEKRTKLINQAYAKLLSLVARKV